MKTIPALIDTGSDFTVIPHHVAVFLSLRKYTDRPVGGAMGGPGISRPVFKADLRFLDFSFSNHPMVSLEDRIHMLIGRDILNKYTTTLHGRDLQFFIE